MAAYHDICYDMGRNKNDCDQEIVQSLDAIPYGEIPKWDSSARFLINTKKKLGLGLQKNALRRSVVIGLDNWPTDFTNQSQETFKRDQWD